VQRVRLPLILLVLLSALALGPGAARPAATGIALTGSVGPGFSISLRDANGNLVSNLAAGDYTITIQNLSDPSTGVTHNFHLEGPGVNMLTTFDPGTTVWDVTVTDGKYTYLCDAHPTIMIRTFTVGNAPPPPPPVTKLSGKVAGKSITLKKGSAVVKSLKHGKFSISVNDASAKDNFHLKGPGVSKKTSVPKRGKATWKVTLRKGKYTYFSDAHRKLKRSFSVK
jgi:hypothetical protein